MSAQGRALRSRLGVALGVALSALACRSLVGIDELSLAAGGEGGTTSGGTGGSAAKAGAAGATSGAAGAGEGGTSTMSGGSSGATSSGGAGGRGGSGGTSGGKGGAPAGGGGATGGAPPDGGGGAPPECGGSRGPCIMCCHSNHMSAGQVLDMYLRPCACAGSSCASACSDYCAPGPPDAACSTCSNDLLKDASCDALSQCDGDATCAPLSACIEACP